MPPRPKFAAQATVTVLRAGQLKRRSPSCRRTHVVRQDLPERNEWHGKHSAVCHSRSSSCSVGIPHSINSLLTRGVLLIRFPIRLVVVVVEFTRGTSLAKDLHCAASVVRDVDFKPKGWFLVDRRPTHRRNSRHDTRRRGSHAVVRQ